MPEKDKKPSEAPRRDSERDSYSPRDPEYRESGTVDDSSYADEKRKEEEKRIAEENRRRAEEDARRRNAEDASSFRNDAPDRRSDLSRSSSKTPSFAEDTSDYSSIDNTVPSDGILDNTRSEQDVWDELSKRAGVDPRDAGESPQTIDASFEEKETVNPEVIDDLQDSSLDASAFHTDSYNDAQRNAYDYYDYSARDDGPRVLDNISNEQSEYDRQMNLGENDPARIDMSRQADTSNPEVIDVIDPSGRSTSSFDDLQDSGLDASAFHTDSYNDAQRNTYNNYNDYSARDDEPRVLDSISNEQSEWDRRMSLGENDPARTVLPERTGQDGAGGFEPPSFRPDEVTSPERVYESTSSGRPPVSDTFDASVFHTGSYESGRDGFSGRGSGDSYYSNPTSTPSFHTSDYTDRKLNEINDLSHSVKGDVPIGILGNTYDEQKNWEKQAQMPGGYPMPGGGTSGGYNPTIETVRNITGPSYDDLAFSRYTGYSYEQMTKLAETFKSSGGQLPITPVGPGGPPPTGPSGGGGGGFGPYALPSGDEIILPGGKITYSRQPGMPMLPAVIPIAAPATIMNRTYAAQGRYATPNFYGGGAKLIECNPSMMQRRSEFGIVPVGNAYSYGKGKPIALKPTTFIDVEFKEKTPPQTFRDKGIILNVKATGEKRQRLAMATGMLISRTGRMAIQQIAVNGAEAGAGLGRMLSYTETAMAVASVAYLPVGLVFSMPHRAGMKNQFKAGSLVFDSKEKMMSALHMSNADFMKGLKKGTIVKNANGGFVKKITSRQEYIAHLNKQFEMAGVKIRINPNLSGNQLVAVSKRYRKRLLAQAKAKGIPKEQLETILKKLKESERMGYNTQFVKGRKFRLSAPVKRSLSQLARTLSKNGDLAGAGLQTVLGYQRAAVNAVKTFIKSVKHIHAIGSLAIKASKKAAMKAALAAVSRGGKMAGLGNSYISHVNKKAAKKTAKMSKKAAKLKAKAIKKAAKKEAFKSTKLGRLSTKIGNGWTRFKNLPNALAKAAWKKVAGSRLGVWASKSKLFHNPLTKGLAKLGSLLGAFMERLKYAIYKIKQTLYLAAGGLLIIIIVSSIFMSLVSSVIGSMSFLTVKKEDRDELVQTLNDLYIEDMHYMVDKSPANGITFENDKDEALYEENTKDYKKDKKKFEETTNLAEILSMAYVRFNYDFKHAKFSPSKEAQTNGLALPADYNFDSVEARSGMSWTVPDKTTTYVYKEDGHTYTETGKLGSVATYTNIPYINWDESSDSYKMIQLWKSKGSKITNGVCTIDGLYMIAMLEKFGHVGDEVVIQTSEGKTLPCVIMDIKRSTDPGVNEWGHNEGQCIIETEQYSKGRGVNNLLIGNGRVTGIKNVCSYTEKHKSANELLAEAKKEKSSDGKSDKDNDKSKDKGEGKTKKHEDGGNEKKVWDALKKQGFSDIAAAAIMGNIQQESGFDPKNTNSNGAYGLCQWMAERKSNLMQRKKYDTINTQIEYLCWEFSNGYKSAYDKLKKASSIEECVKIMVEDYERPGNTEAEISKRTPFAKNIYKKYATGDDVMKVGSEMYDSAEDLYTGMDAVKQYVTDLYHGSHQIVENTNEDGKVTDITYRTVFFGNLFDCGLSENRITTNSANDLVTSSLNGSSYMVDGVIPVPYINQAQGWLDESTKTYSKENFDTTIPGTDRAMQTSGCGLCSTAMAVTYGTGSKVNPGEFSKWYVPGQGSRKTILTEGPAKYGLQTQTFSSIDDAIASLQKGYPVLMHWPHHYVLLTGYKSDGTFAVNDPGKQANAYPYNGKTFTKEEIEEKAKGSGDSSPYVAVIPNAEVLANATNDGSTLTDAQEKVLTLAKSKIGCAYESGSGHSEADCKNDKLDKFDCSGLANWVFVQAGVINKPVGDSGAWANYGTKVDYKDAVPGDVLTKDGHVAIYIGNDKLIEATKPGSTVQMKTTVRDSLKHNVRRILKNVSPDTNYGSGKVKIGNKTFTRSQLIAALSAQTNGEKGKCGVWVREAWQAISGVKCEGLGVTPGATGGYAQRYGIALGCENNIDKEIPLGADVIFKYSGADAKGHIGIYIGNDQYISNLDGGAPDIRHVKNGNNGLSRHNGRYDGWVWHHSGTKQVVFPA